jgi:hypothetical protein
MASSDSNVRFIRRNGKVIPIRAALQAARATRVGVATAKVGLATSSAHKVFRGSKQSGGLRQLFHREIKVNRGFDALGLGLSVASGIIGAATFSSGTKGFLAGAAASHAIDAAGVAANVASVSARGV